MSLIVLLQADHEIANYDPKLDYLTKSGIAYTDLQVNMARGSRGVTILSDI